MGEKDPVGRTSAIIIPSHLYNSCLFLMLRILQFKMIDERMNEERGEKKSVKI